jgi:hypothetical protein
MFSKRANRKPRADRGKRNLKTNIIKDKLTNNNGMGMF